MEKENKYLILTIAIAIILSLILISPQQPEKKIIKTSFLVGETPAFDLNPNELTFGRITTNNSASRAITVTNDKNKPKQISIEISGEISKYITASENNFTLNPNESKNITFSVYSTNLEEPKKYEGEIIIISKS